MKFYKDLTPKQKRGYDRIRDIITDFNMEDTLKILEVLNNVYFGADYREGYYILSSYWETRKNRSDNVGEDY